MWTSGCGERMRAEHPDPEVTSGTGEEPDSGGSSGRGTGSEQDGGGRDRMAEELRLLLDAAAQRAEEYLRGAGGAERDRGAGPSGETGSGGASCGWCPICAVAALVRGDQPELTAKLADQLSGLVELLRGTLAEHRHTDPAGPAAETAEPAAEPASKVQRIEVRRVRGKTAAAAGKGASMGERDC